MNTFVMLIGAGIIGGLCALGVGITLAWLYIAMGE